jgi:hypothetical protein
MAAFVMGRTNARRSRGPLWRDTRKASIPYRTHQQGRFSMHGQGPASPPTQASCVEFIPRVLDIPKQDMLPHTFADRIKFPNLRLLRLTRCKIKCHIADKLPVMLRPVRYGLYPVMLEACRFITVSISYSPILIVMNIPRCYDQR